MRVEQSAELKKKYVTAVGLEAAFPETDFSEFDLHIFRAGEYLCRAGDYIEFFHVIVEGKCKVIPSAETGKEVLLTYMEPIAFHGDIELFNECQALHSVKAASKVVTIAITRKLFFGEKMNQIPFLQMLCKYFATKIYNSSHQSSRNMLYPTRNRLNRIFLETAAEQGANILQIKPFELALQLGVTTRHLRRIMGEYEEKGLICRSDGKITLLDIKALQSESTYF